MMSSLISVCSLIAGITCQCPYNCSANVNEAEQQRIFEDFYQLGSYDAQNKYLCLISALDVKRHTIHESTRPRNHSVVYQVRLIHGSHEQVCKKSFCDLHAIGKCRVENLVKKITHGVLIASDLHGKHQNRTNAIANGKFGNISRRSFVGRVTILVHLIKSVSTLMKALVSLECIYCIRKSTSLR